MYSVIVIKYIFGSFITDHPDRIHIDRIHAFCCICYRNAFAGADEERYFVKGDIYIMDAFFRGPLQRCFRRAGI